MAAIKSYTDISQSKTLSKILPLESADMCYLSDESLFPKVNYNGMVFFNIEEEKPSTIIPCWSLAALLSVLPFRLIVNKQWYAFSMHKGLDKDGETYMFRYNIFNTDVCLYSTDYYNNPVDACFDMVEKLKELGWL